MQNSETWAKLHIISQYVVSVVRHWAVHIHCTYKIRYTGIKNREYWNLVEKGEFSQFIFRHGRIKSLYQRSFIE
jgi:hypothetical protein